MKTRMGFVSNSSSSSFVLMTTLENFNKALDDLPDEEQRKIVRNYFIDGEFGGVPIVTISKYCPMDGGYYINGEQLDYKDSSILYKMYELIHRNPKDVFENEEEW